MAAMLETFPGTKILGIDRDPDTVALLQERFRGIERVHVRASSYTGAPRILEELGLGPADGVLFDLGFSSIQLDDPERGFSHAEDGPLDMRFDRSSSTRTVADMVNGLSRVELADIIYRFGEEGRSRRIAEEIVKRRPLWTTAQLADAVRTAVGGHRVKVLSRVFQAFRIAVNGELEHLQDLLDGLHSWTSSGCRTAFITFHSLEDRMVKLFFRDSNDFLQSSPSWVVAGDVERRSNPRSRSARMRMGVRS